MLWGLKGREYVSTNELPSACSAACFRGMELLGLGVHLQLLPHVRHWCHCSPVLAPCVCPGLQINLSSDCIFVFMSGDLL